ncbi:MAG TPA: tetratricopeptide repeat protein [Bryobacteraceae bacterium]
MSRTRTIPTQTICTTLASIILVTGCATRHATSHSTGEQEAQNGASHTAIAAEAPKDGAQILFTTSGMPMAVSFSTSTSDEACSGFQRVGTVFDSGRGVILPSIARLTEKLNKAVMKTETSRTVNVEPGVQIQVKGLYGDDMDHRFDSCGPFVTSLVPEKGHTYHVNFAFNARQSCSQSMTDITVRDHPVPAGRPLHCSLRDRAVSTADNPLRTKHEQALEAARQKEVAANSASDKAFALQDEAAALDSLGRSDEALVRIDEALRLADPARSKDLIATKAGIEFSLNNPQQALALLAPEIKKTREFAERNPQYAGVGALGTYTEGFVTATFAHIQLEQWKAAIETLADAESPLEGPSFYAYRALVYRYIMARAHDASLANARLERDATDYAASDKNQYGVLLRTWQGEDVLKELSIVNAGLSAAVRQEAEAEEQFYLGAYAKFVKGDAQAARSRLRILDQLAPYGSVEWIYGRRVLQ